MNKLIDDYVIPGITGLVGLFVGLATWKLGSSPAEAIIIGVGVDLVILAHFVLRRISGLEHLLGSTRGVSSMIRSIETVNDLSKLDNPWLKEALKQEIEKFGNALSSLKDNRLTLSLDEFMDFANKFFPTLAKGDSVRATSIFGGGDYWDKVYGQKYARLNKDAAARGVTITRVFVPRNEENNRRLGIIYAEQSKYSRVLVANDADVREIRGELRDFLVFGETLAFEFNFDPDMANVRSITVWFNREEVKRLGSLMERIISVANEANIG